MSDPTRLALRRAERAEALATKLAARVQQLEHALVKYGQHSKGCSYRPAWYDSSDVEVCRAEVPCDCGLARVEQGA